MSFVGQLAIRCNQIDLLPSQRLQIWLSDGQRQLARRCATIAIECEKLKFCASSGRQIDLDCCGQVTDRLGLAFGRLGLKRAARDLAPSLGEYVAARAEETLSGSVEGEEGLQSTPRGPNPRR